MKRPSPRHALRGLPLLACLLLVTLAGATTPEFSLDWLMRQFAAVEHRQSRFSERREMALLDNSLESTGTLVFDAPDRLSKRYDPPDGRRYTIAGNRLTVRGANGREEIVLLDNAPRLLAFVASLRAVLAGDLRQLQTYFDTRLSGTPADWRLTLTPSASPLSQQLQRIEITGRQATLLQFSVIEQGGDRIVTRLQADDEK